MSNATLKTRTPRSLLNVACPYCGAEKGETCTVLRLTGRPFCASRLALASRKLAPVGRMVVA